jgi:hypothetical protein
MRGIARGICANYCKTKKAADLLWTGLLLLMRFCAAAKIIQQ